MTTTSPAVSLDWTKTTFVCVDIQVRLSKVWTEENKLDEYRRLGFSVQELNDTEKHFHEVMLPSALIVAEFARKHGMPRIFVHWKDGRVNESFKLLPEDRIIPKTEMDAFISSNIEEVLESFGNKTLLMIGGHTQGCLGRTARSALGKGYACYAVRDATYDCSYKRWPKGIADVPYTAVLSLKELLSLD